jgi:indole-3-glycerol phosphate synthase
MILTDIVERTRKRVDELHRHMPENLSSSHACRSFEDSIGSVQGRNAVIAEIKFASPSGGSIRKDTDGPVPIARLYEEGGAAGISILTEPYYFHGALENIGRVKAVTGLPVLRKDFIIDELQIAESRAFGADAVLLIAALLGERLPSFVRECKRSGIEPLVEIHSRDEGCLAAESGASLVGINNRDLKTMKINLNTTRILSEEIRREDLTVVSESGICWPYDVRCLKKYCDAFLIGRSLMMSEDPKKVLEGFVFA